jgi:ribose transport system substrate-binding protein
VGARNEKRAGAVVPRASANLLRTTIACVSRRGLTGWEPKSCRFQPVRLNYNPCQVGHIYDVKASALDEAIYRGFSSSTAGHANIRVVAGGQSYFTSWDGLTAAQSMLESHPDLTLIVGSDQGIESAQKAVAGAGKTGKVILVGYGASAAALSGVRSGAWYGDVAQLPTSEGRVAVEDLVRAIRTGVSSGGVDPVCQLPSGGVITKSDVGQFHAEWPG